jgi:putative transposase
VNYYDFRTPIQTLADLDLPQPDPSFPKGQSLDMRKGELYRLLCRRGRKYGEFSFERWQTNVHGRRFAELRQVGAAEVLHLFEDQILVLEKDNRIVPLNDTRADVRYMPGGVHSLTTEQVAEAMKRIEYLDAVNARKAKLRRVDLPDSEKKEIMAVVAERRGEVPPKKGWMCKVMRIERDEKALNRIVKFAPKRTRGNRTPRFPDELYAIKERAVVEALTANMGAEDARIRFKELVSEGGPYAFARAMALDEDGEPVMKEASFRTTINALGRYTVNRLRDGGEYAGREASISVIGERPRGVLDIVDVDHSTLPVKVYDPLFPSVAYGRPDVILFRDRFSGNTFGYSVSFSEPSFASFIAGFKHAVYPKDDLNSSVSWPWFGTPKRLGVDWATHLTGDQMALAEKMLGFSVVKYRPRVPEDKAALEHCFDVLDVGLLRSTPGYMPRPHKRKRKDFEEQDVVAEISIVEMHMMLEDFIANRLNRTPRTGLGDLPTQKQIPAALWDADIPNHPPRGLIDPEAFVWLGGESRDDATIQGNGIRWDHLIYQSDALFNVVDSKNHQPGVRDDKGRNHGATKYTVTRSLEDLGGIWLIDHHHGNEPIRVPIQPSLASYANGLTVHQHHAVLKFQAEELEKNWKKYSFQEAYEALRNMQIDMAVQNRRDHFRKKIAKHVEKQGLKLRRAIALDLTHVESGGRTSLAEPSRIEVREPRSPRAQRRPQPHRPDPSQPAPTAIIPKDAVPAAPAPPAPAAATEAPRRPTLAELRARRTDWK